MISLIRQRLLSQSVNNTPEEAKLLKEAFIKFANAGNNIRLEQFRIGPVISRALYQVGDIDSLQELFEDAKTAEYFKLRSAYNVYLSFLYKKERYEEVLKVGEELLDVVLNETKVEIRNADLDNGLITYLAAANKIGTKEALDRSRKMLHDFKEKILKNTGKLRMKQIMLYHLLCVKNNDLNEALEVLSSLRTSHYEYLNAKAAILIRLGRTEECLQTIERILEPDNRMAKYVFTETIDIIKQELAKNPNEQLQEKIDSIDKDKILDTKIEDTILALPNANRTQNTRDISGNRRPFNNN